MEDKQKGRDDPDNNPRKEVEPPPKVIDPLLTKVITFSDKRREEIINIDIEEEDYDKQR